MTRREFRGLVAAPRPRAAWLMSLVAAATLWLTEQLPPWVAGIQLAAFVLSYATRLNPPPFRSDPIWLNVLMLGVTTITIRSALSGNPATVSLAYFTSLAQGLQLLDARPRRSEFVLVALALFQVVLASNLTDSVFFPPLVLAFLVCVTWTLLVHTLALEAAEAGDPEAVGRVIAPDLRFMTAIATSACVVLALGLFVLLPRLKTSVLQGNGSNRIGFSGFSEQVSLGESGRIRLDHSVVLRVEAVEGELPAPVDAYWRGLAFDAFDGRRWSISASRHTGQRQAISGVGRFGIELRPRASAAHLPAPTGQHILREALEADVLFSAGEVERIEGPFQRLERDPNGGLYVPGRGDDRLRYTVWSQARPPSAERLRADRARPPRERGPGGSRLALRYLALPALDPRLRERAVEWTRGATTDYDRALRLEQSLRERGRYTDSPPPLGDERVSPIEAFLLEGLEGHCEYFASAMVVLARLEGLPARLINGFAGGQRNEVGGFVEVTQADAHAWVEIHFERAGWVRFDPTPPDRRLRAETALSMTERIAQIASAIELWWFQRVVDYDSADQIGALRGLWMRFGPREGLRDVEVREQPAPDAGASFSLEDALAQGSRGLIALALIGGIGLLVRIGLLRRRTGAALPASYRQAQRMLARRGLVRKPATSARDFAAQVARALPEPGGPAFRELTDAYLATRFGGRPELDQRAALDALRDAVDRMGLRNDPHVREEPLGAGEELETAPGARPPGRTGSRRHGLDHERDVG